ncbi:hypothetical protein [Chryseobacterium sp. Leaf180]|uniref:hypothetical protein n=1 Tax=Chryseobacterium sp. Leaf180 TaxID=1736289 RepID=UPI00103BC61B|nr:hypothetical protein [Chryseobacterium sp. Leaf180]
MKTIRTFFTFILIIFSSTIIASIFGIINNQISYTISNEFFEYYLFGNFGTNNLNISNKRIEASIVGIIGTYWVGLIIGFIYAIIFLFLKHSKKLENIYLTILINIAFAILGSLIGFLIANFLIGWENSGVFIDFGIQHPQNYVNAAYMNSGSYYGGFIGLIFGIIYLLKKDGIKILTRKNAA